MMKNGGPRDGSYWQQPTWPAAQQFNANIYVIMLGTNDAKYLNADWVLQNYTSDYIDMVSKLRDQPAKPRVFLVVPPPLYPTSFNFMNSTVVNTLLPQLIPRVAAESGAIVIDGVFEAMGGSALAKPQLICDGCHPNDDGYVVIADVIFKAISSSSDLVKDWPALSPATAKQVTDAEPWAEWNPGHPELFLHRPSVYQSFPLQTRLRFEKNKLQKFINYAESRQHRTIKKHH